MSLESFARPQVTDVPGIDWKETRPTVNSIFLQSDTLLRDLFTTQDVAKCLNFYSRGDMNPGFSPDVSLLQWTHGRFYTCQQSQSDRQSKMASDESHHFSPYWPMQFWLLHRETHSLGCQIRCCWTWLPDQIWNLGKLCSDLYSSVVANASHALLLVEEIACLLLQWDPQKLEERIVTYPTLNVFFRDVVVSVDLMTRPPPLSESSADLGFELRRNWGPVSAPFHPLCFCTELWGGSTCGPAGPCQAKDSELMCMGSEIHTDYNILKNHNYSRVSEYSWCWIIALYYGDFSFNLPP